MSPAAICDAVVKHYRDRYGDFPAFWGPLKNEMNRLTGYGNYGNTASLDDGMAAVYASIVSPLEKRT